jgi:hypothetical protein
MAPEFAKGKYVDVIKNGPYIEMYRKDNNIRLIPCKNIGVVFSIDDFWNVLNLGSEKEK